jgi:hypothetical protein
MKGCIPAFAAVLAAFPLWADSRASANVLQDQFGRMANVAIGAGRGVLIVISDRPEAGELVEVWLRGLAPLPASIDPWFIADLKALPFFIPHGPIMNWLAKKHPVNRILLDWTGGFCGGLAPGRNDVTVFVFAPDGALLGRASGRPTPEKISAMRGSLEKAAGRLAGLP